MIIAQQKKQENIAEYLLYMWQIEDLIRAYNFNLLAIENEIISQFNLDAETNRQMVDWYDNLIQLMLNEKIEEKGHLQFVKNYINDLTNLHFKLLNSPYHTDYKKEFEKTTPYLADLVKKTNNKEKPFVEICLEGLYGALILKLSNKKISNETTEAVQAIGNFIAILTSKYQSLEQDADFLI